MRLFFAWFYRSRSSAFDVLAVLFEVSRRRDPDHASFAKSLLTTD